MTVEFYSGSSLFTGAHAAVRQTEVNKEIQTEAQGGKCCREKLGRMGGGVLAGGGGGWGWGEDVSDGMFRKDSPGDRGNYSLSSRYC